jgi:hypothetical protein
MLQGALIAESIRPGTSLDDLHLIVRQITRHAPDGTTDEQPPIWTDIYFEVDEKDAEDLARKLADVLDASGWYADLRSDAETPSSCTGARSSVTRAGTRRGGLTPWRTAAPREFPTISSTGPSEAGNWWPRLGREGWWPRLGREGWWPPGAGGLVAA